MNIKVPTSSNSSTNIFYKIDLNFLFLSIFKMDDWCKNENNFICFVLKLIDTKELSSFKKIKVATSENGQSIITFMCPKGLDYTQDLIKVNTLLEKYNLQKCQLNIYEYDNEMVEA